MIYTGSVYDADTTNPNGRCQRPACQHLFDQALAWGSSDVPTASAELITRPMASRRHAYAHASS
jgi:hypothetical protein